MNATPLIIDTLRTMGANPTVTTDKNGYDIIKINAPVINEEGNKND